eukprot:gene884-1107_t
MKFGKYLRNNMHQEWEEKYLDYKRLKKFLMELVEELQQNNQPRHSLFNNNYASFEAPFIQTSDRNSKFLLAIWKQFLSVDKFISEKERDISQRSIYLTTSRDAGLIISTIKEIEKLINFVEMNQEGFRKILKKFDKKATATVGNEYFNNMIRPHLSAKNSVISLHNSNLINIYTKQFGDYNDLKLSEQSESVFTFSMLDEQ